MQEHDKNHDLDELDRLLAVAAAPNVPVNAALMDRVLADASAVQARQAKPLPAPASQVPLWTRITDVLGGWQCVSALTASVCVGLVVGFSAPDTVSAFIPGLVDGTLDTEFGDGAFYGADLLGEDDA